MNKIYIAFCLILSTFQLLAKDEKTDFFIKENSILMIHGDANILKFTCHLKNAFNLTSFTLKGKKKKKMFHLEEGKILVPIKNLDCGNNEMNKEMIELLKGKEYPYITLNFKELSVPDWKKEGEFLKSSAFSKVTISVGGLDVTYPVHLDLVKVNEKNILASGNKKFKITDFNITPKSYLLGLAKINEMIEIDFQLVLTK